VSASDDMFDWPSCEIPLSIVDATAGAVDDCKQQPLRQQLVDHSLGPFDCASGIDLADDAAEVVDDDVDDASAMEYQIPRHQMMACEMSAS